MRKFRNAAPGAILAAAALLLAACGSGGGGNEGPTPARGGSGQGQVTVGAVQFAENQIVAEMYAAALEKTGYKVARNLTIGKREILQPALEKGEIDVAPEYLGSLMAFLQPDAKPSGDPDEVAAPLKELLAKKNQTLLEFSEANDTNAFVVTKATADKYHLKSVGDLKPVASQLTLGGPPECPERPFCLPGLKDVYGVTGIKFQPVGVCDSLTATALQEGRIDVAVLCSTQAVISANGWVTLTDDKNLQRAENIVPVVNTRALNDEIRDLLNQVSAKLTTAKIVKLNARVEIDKEDPDVVARDFLKEEGLL